MYQDGARYWYGTQPTVTKLAEDRAEELRRHPDQVAGELEKRLRDDCRQRGEFAGVHVLPDSPADVPDVLDARLVLLPSTAPYVRGEDNPAIKLAERFLESRGSGPRMYRNTLVFLAADAARFKDLDEALRRYLAWDSIVADVQKLNLDPHQAGQAEAQCEAAQGAVVARIPETYQWLLVPDQEQPDAAVGWKTLRLAASGPLAERAGRRLLNDELLVVSLGPTVLRLHLDRVPLWRGEHVSVRQLVEDFGQYLYLPRLKGPSVLERAVEDGVGLLTWEHDAFAFADSYDQAAERYRGLRFMQGVTVVADATGLVVKPGPARAQIEKEKPGETPSQSDELGEEPSSYSTTSSPTTQTELEEETPSPRRFHATARLNAQRIGVEASQIADEVVAHLAGLIGTDVTVTLEIEATLAPGLPEHVQRTVTENSVTLGFDSHAFEDH